MKFALLSSLLLMPPVLLISFLLASLNLASMLFFFQLPLLLTCPSPIPLSLMISSLQLSPHYIKITLFPPKIFPVIDLSPILTLFLKFLNVLSIIALINISPLSNRSLPFSIQSHLSISASISTGVPQGSVLGPLLFCLYTTPLTYLFSDSPVSYHLYADDTQLYISFSASDSIPNLSTISSTLDTFFDWFTENRLPVNPSKAEFLLVGTPQQRSKVTSLTISFQ